MKHNNRCWLRIMCLLSVCCLLAVSIGHAALDSTEALMAAYGIIREDLNLGPMEVTIVMQHYDKLDGYWTFQFEQKEHPDTNGQIFIQFNPDGSLNEYLPPRSNRELELERRLEAEWLGRYAFRGVEEWAQLKSDWVASLDDLSILVEKLHSPDHPHPPYTWQVAEVVGRDITLPAADAIPVETARRTALEALRALPGMTQEKLDYYELRMEIYYHSQELGRPVYQIVYAQQHPPQSDAAFDKWLRDYADPLDNLFGGEFAAPIYMSVRIDAITGMLAEAPNVQDIAHDFGKYPVLMVR